MASPDLGVFNNCIGGSRAQATVQAKIYTVRNQLLTTEKFWDPSAGARENVKYADIERATMRAKGGTTSRRPNDLAFIERRAAHTGIEPVHQP